MDVVFFLGPVYLQRAVWQQTRRRPVVGKQGPVNNHDVDGEHCGRGQLYGLPLAMMRQVNMSVCKLCYFVCTRCINVILPSYNWLFVQLSANARGLNYEDLFYAHPLFSAIWLCKHKSFPRYLNLDPFILLDFPTKLSTGTSHSSLTQVSVTGRFFVRQDSSYESI